MGDRRTWHGRWDRAHSVTRCEWWPCQPGAAAGDSPHVGSLPALPSTASTPLPGPGASLTLHEVLPPARPPTPSSLAPLWSVPLDCGLLGEHQACTLRELGALLGPQQLSPCLFPGTLVSGERTGCVQACCPADRCGPPTRHPLLEPGGAGGPGRRGRWLWSPERGGPGLFFLWRCLGQAPSPPIPSPACLTGLLWAAEGQLLLLHEAPRS